MNSRNIPPLAALLLLISVAAAFPQGVLTPPLPPGPAMKTLDQLEPRTPVDASHTPGDANHLFIISAPGSYYLTSDISGVDGKTGIHILASDVTLDLCGFSLIGSAVSTRGIQAGVASRVVIRNGSVRGWFFDGIDMSTSTLCRIERVICAGNGLSQGYGGITAGVETIVSECTAQGNGKGITTDDDSLVIRCTASGNTQTGIAVGDRCMTVACMADSNGTGITSGDDCVLQQCTASSNTGTGITAGNNCRLDRCTANLNGGTGTTGSGITALIRTVIDGCITHYNRADGVKAAGDCVLRANRALSNGQGTVSAGLHTTGSGNRIENNDVRNNTGAGVKSDSGSGADTVIRNLSSGNTTNYSPSSGTSFAPVQSPDTATNPWANF